MEDNSYATAFFVGILIGILGTLIIMSIIFGAEKHESAKIGRMLVGTDVYDVVLKQ